MSDKIKKFFQERNIESTPLLDYTQEESCQVLYQRACDKYRFHFYGAWFLVLFITAVSTYLSTLGEERDPHVCISERDKQSAIFISLFFGLTGADRFYLGYVTSSIFKLLTFGGAGIWWVIDLVWISKSLLPDVVGCVLE